MYTRFFQPNPAANAGRLEEKPGGGVWMINIPLEAIPVAQAVCNGVQISYDDNGMSTPTPPLSFCMGTD